MNFPHNNNNGGPAPRPAGRPNNGGQNRRPQQTRQPQQTRPGQPAPGGAPPQQRNPQVDQRQPAASVLDAYDDVFGAVLPRAPSRQVFEDLGITGSDWYMIAKQYNDRQTNAITTEGIVLALLRSKAEGIPYHIMAWQPVCVNSNEPNAVWSRVELYRWRAAKSGNYGGLQATWAENLITIKSKAGDVVIPEWVSVVAIKFVGGVQVATNGCIITAENCRKSIQDAKSGSSWYKHTQEMMFKRAEKMALKKLYPAAIEASPAQQVAFAEAALKMARVNSMGGMQTVVLPDEQDGEGHHDDYPGYDEHGEVYPEGTQYPDDTQYPEGTQYPENTQYVEDTQYYQEDGATEYTDQADGYPEQGMAVEQPGVTREVSPPGRQPGAPGHAGRSAGAPTAPRAPQQRGGTAPTQVIRGGPSTRPNPRGGNTGRVAPVVPGNNAPDNWSA